MGQARQILILTVMDSPITRSLIMGTTQRKMMAVGICQKLMNKPDPAQSAQGIWAGLMLKVSALPAGRQVRRQICCSLIWLRRICAQ